MVSRGSTPQRSEIEQGLDHSTKCEAAHQDCGLVSRARSKNCLARHQCSTLRARGVSVERATLGAGKSLNPKTLVVVSKGPTRSSVRPKVLSRAEARRSLHSVVACIRPGLPSALLGESDSWPGRFQNRRHRIEGSWRLVER